MALKTKQELKEETLRELEEEEKKLKEAEEKKQKAAAETAKKNKENDLIGAKDAEKLNSGNKTSSSVSSAADKAKNSSVTKNSTASAAKQTVSDSVAERAGAEDGIEKIETAKIQKATEQARANKEKDLPGYDGYAAQKAFEQKKADEKIEYLNIKETRDKKSALEKELEQLKQQAKDQNKKAGTAAIVASGMRGRSGSVVDAETQKRIAELEKEINELNKSINLASGVQNKKYLHNSALKADDFEKYSYDPKAEEEKRYKIYKQADQERETETVKEFMTEEQRAVYNYYLNKFGKEKAEEYFDSIREELNKKEAEAIFKGNKGKVLNEYIMGATAGLENSKEGYKGFINMILGIEDPQPASTYDYLAEMAREDLANEGIKLPKALGGASLGQIGFDFVNTGANMLPSIALGTLGGSAVGAAAIGASAAGNAYNNALAEGYSKDQATNYAVLVGASEAALGYALGGVRATGGKIKEATAAKLIPKIDNALAKAAVNVSYNRLWEAGEEYLQEVLTPFYANIALMEDNEIDLLSPDAIYAGIMGALIANGNADPNNQVVPEAAVKTEVPVPFNGTAQPGTEAAMVADKITEIENRPISEAEKAAKMEEVMQAVAGTTGTAEVIAEAEKFKNIHEQNVKNEETKKEKTVSYKSTAESNAEYEDTVPSFVRADINRIVDDPSITNEQKFFDLMALYDSAKTPAEKSEIGRYMYQMKTVPTERKPFFGIKNRENSSAKNSVEQNATFVPEKGIETPEGINLLQEEVETNIGRMPVEDYREILAAQNGFNSYEEMQAEVRAMEEWDRKEEEWRKEQAETQMKEIIREGRSRRFVREETKTAPGASEFVSAEISDSVYGENNAAKNDIRYSTGRSFDEMAGEAKADEMAADVKTVTMERANKDFDVESWKSIAESINPEIGIWRMKDFARVLDSAAGGNKVLRQQLYDLYEKPLNDAQGTYASNYAAKAQSITDKFKELGIKAESKESAAVQRIGEGVKEIDKHGNTVPYTLDDLKKDFPDSWQEIKEGADYCRKVYDDFLRDLNAMYSEIYPATVEQANERVSNYNIRIENDAKYIDRYTEVIETLENRKAEKQSELSKKRPDSLIYAEIQNQIANIDHKIDVAGRRIEQIKNRKLTKEISRDTLKAQIENGEILRNKQIKPRKDYFRHFQELTDEFAEIADIFSNDQRIPPNLAGKSETTKPRTIWTSIAQSRKNGNYYTEDAVSGLLKYTEIAEKLLIFDPLVSHFRDVNSAIRAAGTMVDNEVKGKGNNAGQFASWADDMTNRLAGKTNIIDRIISDKTGAFGRATIKAVEALNHRVKSNAILGNFRSALVQIGNLPNAMLYIQNPADWTMGAVSLTNPTEEIIDARAKSNFMNRRYMGDTIDALTKEIQDNNILDKPKEFALWMLGAGDKAAAELIWHTAYSRAVRNPEVLNSKKSLRNYADAIDYADDITRRSIGGRAEGDIPYFEESKITGLIAPFQIEVANTANALAEQIGKKNVAGIIAFEAGIWLINTVLEGITGDRPLGFDYIEAITDIVKEATGEEEEEEKDIWELVTFGLGRLAGETISGLPFGAQIGRAITGGDEQRAEEWFGDSDPSRYGTGNIGIGALADAADYFIKGETPKKLFELATDGEKNSYAEWSEPIKETVDTFAPILMPWGGKQLSRTAGGIDQLIRGGAFGKDSNGNEYLKFPQEYDPESVIKTVLFGQYASDRGQQYIDSEFRDKLSAEQTKQMKLAGEYGISDEEFYDLILGLKNYDTKKEKQEALFNNPDFTAEEKDIIDYIIFGKPTVKAAENGYVEPERVYSSEEGFYRSGLSDSENKLLDAGYSREEAKAIEAAIKKGGNKIEELAEIQKALGCTEAEAFEIYQQRKGDWVNDFESLSEEEKARAKGAADYYGMSAEEYLTVYNYSKFGTVVTDKDGKESYSTSMEDVVPNLAKTLGVTETRAEELYRRVNSYDYAREDLDQDQINDLNKMAMMYGVDDKGYFVAKNAILIAEGQKDEYGNTISGTAKAEAIDSIKKQLGISEEEATIYYLAASGDLILSKDDLSTSHREDLEAAKKYGWTERQYIDAVNLIKVSGASKKDDIIKTLTDAGASYEMAQGYYNLRQNKDYSRSVSAGSTIAYGMSNQKQADKIDYYMEHYNSNKDLSAEDVAKWTKASKGLRKKADIVAAYKSAGATEAEALKLYALMYGKDKQFNSYYKENGGNE